MNFEFEFGRPDSLLVRQFKRFHRENPDFYRLFIRFSLQAASAGRERFSARTVLHRIRWYTSIETRGDVYKVNDHWSPFYARLFEHDFPEHAGLFEMRHAAADDVDLKKVGGE